MVGSFGGGLCRIMHVLHESVFFLQLYASKVKGLYMV